jgi:hypothetical protein
MVIAIRSTDLSPAVVFYRDDAGRANTEPPY